MPGRVALPVTTIVYALTSTASGNLMLTVAALLLGALTAPEPPGLGGVLAPALTHVTWSVAMLPVLPPLFG